MAGGLGEASAAPAAAPATIGGSTLLGLATEQWLTIAAGLVIGMVAHWALLLHANRPLGRRQVRIDAMMFLANGVLAAQAADAAGLSGVKLLTAAMMFGAGSTIVFSFFWSRWFSEQGGGEPGAAIPPAALAEVRHTKRGGTFVTVTEPEPQETNMHGQPPPRGRRKGVGRALRKAHAEALKRPLDEEESRLLAQLDKLDRDASPD